MASAESIDDLLLNPAFMNSVREVYAAMVRAQLSLGSELNVNVALDALSFVGAMLQEAHPEYAGDSGLVDAAENMFEDHKSFLHFMRDHSQQTGQHMLEGVAQRERDDPESPPGPGEELDQLSPVDTLVVGFQQVIMEKSQPRDRTVDALGREGAYVSYDLSTIVSALAWVAGSVAIQSGEIETAKARRLFADEVRRLVLGAMKDAERMLASGRERRTIQ